MKDNKGGKHITKRLSKEERNELRKNHFEQFLKIRDIVNELDPTGLIASGAPKDEHDTLTANILGLIIDKKIEEVRE
ncbi:hypothetical protein H8B09_12175 [Paenibacillus sp. PR3]|uniref:Phage protein n=1 Tax=Paenibacillus terricola TaxID=2763503 RepID=A0ABR8MU74_9BACL|nr:hypothetical protein [Paenibacillus terricola]MBD3919512.1 hypothetical protein [Paenibacillus terricola]